MWYLKLVGKNVIPTPVLTQIMQLNLICKNIICSGEATPLRHAAALQRQKEMHKIVVGMFVFAGSVTVALLIGIVAGDTRVGWDIPMNYAYQSLSD